MSKVGFRAHGELVWVDEGVSGMESYYQSGQKMMIPPLGFSAIVIESVSTFDEEDEDGFIGNVYFKLYDCSERASEWYIERILKGEDW